MKKKVLIMLASVATFCFVTMVSIYADVPPIQTGSTCRSSSDLLCEGAGESCYCIAEVVVKPGGNSN